MRISAEWHECSDLVTRPVVQCRVFEASGRSSGDMLLIDTGADRTVFTAALLTLLRIPTLPLPDGLTFTGVGGSSDVVLIDVILELPTDDGKVARIRGPYGAFTDPTAAEMSILGRDVLDNFDLIMSRRREEVLMLAPNHAYRIIGG